jgi:hypothetical protein
MLQSINQLYRDKIGASDGEIGHLIDFYFDDQNWAVRYAVADTGTWLPGRQVLLSPHAFGRVHQAGKILIANLTRKQIQDSPSIDTHKPISRQYEEEYYRYYGWPYYWQGEGLWGMSGFPILELPPKTAAAAKGHEPRRVDGHLRSTRAVNGYHLKGTDDTVGHVCDFLMDAQSWAITELVIKTGHRFSGKEITLSTAGINRISYEDSTVFVNLTREAIEDGPQHQLALAGAA